MKKLFMIARILLGLIYFIFGLNFFLNFIPVTPPPMPEAAMEYMKGMMAAGYFMPVLKATEVLGGLLLIAGFAAPLGLVVLAPITFQIFLFHSILTPGASNVVLPLIMVTFHLLAAVGYWKHYKPLFGRG